MCIRDRRKRSLALFARGVDVEGQVVHTCDVNGFVQLDDTHAGITIVAVSIIVPVSYTHLDVYKRQL